MLEQKVFPLVNVHVPYEGELAETDLFIPYDRIGRNLEKLPADKGAKVVLYCRSGSMGAIATRELVGLGYTNVWNLSGGMIAWREAGYPLIKRQR
jgi:phage shock protein E